MHKMALDENEDMDEK